VKKLGIKAGMNDEDWSALKFMYRLKDRPPKERT